MPFIHGPYSKNYNQTVYNKNKLKQKACFILKLDKLQYNQNRV